MFLTILHPIASLAFVYLVYSMDEYWVHRSAMHKMRLAKLFDSKWLRSLCYNHMALHHKRGYEHDSHDKDDNIVHVTLAAALPGAIIGIPMYFLDELTFYLLFAGGFAYGTTWWVVHHEMHRSEGRFFASTAWFRYLEQQHQLHHEYPGTNYNLILPLCDWVFRTRPSPEQIKKYKVATA